jgi:hypothetical protein
MYSGFHTKQQKYLDNAFAFWTPIQNPEEQAALCF